MKRVIALGTAGWMPTATRQTMCYAYETRKNLIIFDLGTGISRLSTKLGQELLRKYNPIYVFLSHYHLDHLAGLLYLPRFFKNNNVIVAGPGASIYGRSVQEILNGLSSRPYFALPLSEYSIKFEFVDLHQGKNRINSLDVEVNL
jgi:ribonuclease BN (tRNA processing enzyme)